MSIELKISIQAETGAVVIRSPIVATSAPWDRLKSLLERLIAVPDVTCVVADRRQSVAILHFSKTFQTRVGNAKAAVLRIAQQLRQTTEVTEICDAYSGLSWLQLKKSATSVVGGTICHAIAGQTRVQHPLLRGAPARDAVVGPLLASLNGVERVVISPISGTVTVKHSATISPVQILVAIEQILQRSGNLSCSGCGSIRMLLSGVCVGMAIVAETLAPVLIPVTAGTLVACNLPTLVRGLRELMTLKWRLPALYTVIMGTTLVSGQVLAASLMQVSIVGWYWWSNRRLRSMIAALLSTEAQYHVPDRSNLDPVVSTTTSPDTVSAVMTGIENRISTRRISERRAVPIPTGDASTSFVSGSAYESAITSLARTAMGTQPTVKGHDGAAQFVPFAFLTGAAALLANDMATLAAVLRPDYATGPSISERISMVAAVHQLLRRGWLVVSPDALERLAAIDVVIVLDDQAHPSGDLAIKSAALPDSAFPADSAFPVLAAARQEWKLPSWQKSVKAIRLSGDQSACLSYIQHLSATGTKMAVCGPMDVLALLKKTDVVRIAGDVDESGRLTAGDIVAIRGRQNLLDIWDVLAHQHRCTGHVWPVVLSCNIASVVGAFLAGLTSLHVVILTNLGTFTAYSLFANQIDHLWHKLPGSNPDPTRKLNTYRNNQFKPVRPSKERSNCIAVLPIDRFSETRSFS